MWKIDLPSNLNAIQELATALTYANGKSKYPLSSSEKLAMETIYENYEHLRGEGNDLLKCRSLSSDLLDAIQAAYGEVQIAGRLSALRARLLFNAGLCPCCGIVVADELDHHLPKSIYKALAIYSSNLVPICHKCNNKKRALTGLEPEERFIHVYYDDIPQHAQFLEATISLVGKSLQVEFKIIKIPELADQLYKQMCFQIERVNLNTRLSKEINTFLISLAFILQDAYEKLGKDQVIYYLNGTAQSHIITFGTNHWKLVFLQAFADHEKFCDGGFYEPFSLRPAI